MSIFKIFMGLFVVIVIFQAISIRANAGGINAMQALQLAREMEENIVKLMESNAKLNAEYNIGGRCYFPQKDGYVRLLSFSNEKMTIQPETEYEKDLFKELLLSIEEAPSNKEIHSVDEGIFHYISLVRTTSTHCDTCHVGGKKAEKFKALGALSIKIPVSNERD